MRRTGKRTWRGFTNVEAANGHLQAFEQTFPLDGFVEYTFLRNAGAPGDGLILKAAILKTPDIRTGSDGTAYVRRGAQNIPVTEKEALQRLEYAKGLRSFETHPVDVPLDVVTNSETIIEFMLAVVPTGEPDPWLRKQLLVRDDKPTVTAVLVFADEPQVGLPKQSTIKVYRYATTEAAGSRATLQGQPLTIEGNLYAAIHEAVKTTVEMVEAIRIHGPAGLERVQYPEVALHEIITNAVLHRDYSIADDIHVRVFDNRIEVESPGRLPAHITPENILEERFARNGNIVRWINKFPDPPNKDVGEGLRTAFEAMRQLKLKAPVITESANAVLVTVRHETLASPEEMILTYLGKHPEISNSVVRSLTGIGSENKVKRIFQKMVKTGEVEPIPNRSLRTRDLPRVNLARRSPRVASVAESASLIRFSARSEPGFRRLWSPLPRADLACAGNREGRRRSRVTSLGPKFEFFVASPSQRSLLIRRRCRVRSVSHPATQLQPRNLDPGGADRAPQAWRRSSRMPQAVERHRRYRGTGKRAIGVRRCRLSIRSMTIGSERGQKGRPCALCSLS